MKCRSGIEIQTDHDPDPDPDSEQNFYFHKNFAERHQIWWISLAYKE